MGRKSRFSRDVRERTVRMVPEHEAEYGSEWEAIAGKIGSSARTPRAQPRGDCVPDGLKMATDPDGMLMELIEKDGDPAEIRNANRR